MPVIENYDPNVVVTPLQPEFPKLVDSFRRLSPKSSAEAERIVQQRNIRFALDTTLWEFRFRAAACGTESGLTNQRFKVGLRGLERCWAAVFGYLVFFDWASDRFNAELNGKSVVAPSAQRAAIALLHWAFSSRHKVEEYPWPGSLPSPSSPYPDPDLMARVNATCIRVVGFILLHELGHFERFHLEPDKQNQQLTAAEKEYDADRWAFRLGIAELTPGHEQSNLVTIPFVLGILAGINHREDEEHPSIANRIRRFYNDHMDPLFKESTGSLFNTVQVAITTPLQVQLFLRGFVPNALEPKKNLDVYLSWWEGAMDLLPPPI